MGTQYDNPTAASELMSLQRENAALTLEAERLRRYIVNLERLLRAIGVSEPNIIGAKLNKGG